MYFVFGDGERRRAGRGALAGCLFVILDGILAIAEAEKARWNGMKDELVAFGKIEQRVETENVRTIPACYRCNDNGRRCY